MNVEIGKRADVFLKEYLLENGYKYVSRTFLKENWNKFLLVKGKGVKPSYKFREGDTVEIDTSIIDSILSSVVSEFTVEAQVGEIDVVYEDQEILVLNKAKGIAVHPGVGHPDGTLANYVRGYLEQKGCYDESIKRAGIVHRLDKGVSGLIVFAKTRESQVNLQTQFEAHEVSKIYLAGVKYKSENNVLKEYFPPEDLSAKTELDRLESENFVCDGSWYEASGYIKRSERTRVKMKFTETKVGLGRKSVTYIKPLNEREILVKIETGRMHQIRATLEHYDINIVGDTLYGVTNELKTPSEIELASIALSFKNLSGDKVTFRLEEFK